jgi:hypothetical protein
MKPPTRKSAKSDEVIEAEMGIAPVIKPEIKALEVIGRIKSTAEARIESVNNLLSKAYEQASKLQLTADEIKTLTADFEDSDFRRGAAGKDNLIYIEHQSLRNRLNKVIGIGQWSLIIRRNWTEEFEVPPRPPSKVATVGVRVYVEAILIVRGCYVGEAVGDGTYYKSNASGNLGDALESAKSAALRRCCKEFGIGLQAWNKDFCDGWQQKYPGFERPVKTTNK